MISKKSFFNWGIIKQDLKQHGWLSFAYIIGLFFSLPLQIMIFESQYHNEPTSFSSFFDIYGTEIQFLTIAIIPVLTALLIFRYIQNEQSVDMMHSLPIQRDTLYISHLISGLAILIIPILINTLITFFVWGQSSKILGLSFSHLLSWGGWVILLSIFIYLFTVVVGMITGMSMVQAVLAYILLAIPFILFLLIDRSLEMFYYGYSSLEHYIDLMGIINFADSYSLKEAILYSSLSIILFIIAYIFYLKRNLENATQVIAFQWIKPIFKYGFTFCSMLVSGLYLFRATSDSLHLGYLGFISGTVIGYIVAEMILQKSWHIFQLKVFKGLIYYIVCIGIIFTCLTLDVFNYEDRVPKLDSIASVYIGNHPYELDEMEELEIDPFMSKSSFIKGVQTFHTAIVEEKPKVELNNGYDNIFIAYTLHNGQKVYREYRIPSNKFDEYWKPLHETPEYKRRMFRTSLLDQDIQLIDIYGEQSGSSVVIKDPLEVQELTNILKSELLSQTYEQITDLRSPIGRIEVYPFDPKKPAINIDPYYYSRQYELKGSYNALLGWLEDKGYLEKIKLNLEKIRSMKVVKTDEFIHGLDAGPIFNENLYEKEIISIDVKDQPMLVDDILTNYTSDYYGSGDSAQYFIKIEVDSYDIYGVILDQYVSEDVKELFE
ncbi:DUF6449 domain-containing protein [Bacillus carboniphilus]|uniref:DUF6449 domain-containing protein n=1 Tax=Bacillus carboniphilus TaxID=86663 RepID=A0ABY9JQW7_9BACI|nr:DUF6449 domain-containing protein [Bacillus carboniphilus]WLR41794.1 DUF6449 domain-containing protein [Bacillus carboniphilus]